MASAARQISLQVGRKGACSLHGQALTVVHGSTAAGSVALTLSADPPSVPSVAADPALPDSLLTGIGSPSPLQATGSVKRNARSRFGL
jgi:hypothetical protein